ncbi:MAG: nucleotidyltransferase domain-containing protein [Desulfobacterota bacterium]|nr:nucleotidyltransferase domain-containing protein [Thermodesulfobacteriota bacterium]
MEIEFLKQQIITTFKPFNPYRIIILGPIARNDWDKVSDIDLIIVYQRDKPFLDRLKELYLSWDIPKPMDILAYNPEKFEQMSHKIFLSSKY